LVGRGRLDHRGIAGGKIDPGDMIAGSEAYQTSPFGVIVMP
jgi:hypothetical protein